MTTAYVTERRRARPSVRAAGLPWLLAAAVVGVQIAYPLLDEGSEALRRLTIATVLVFFAASVAHAWVHRGAGWALGLVVVTAGGGLAAEAVGVATGYPFGTYSYSTSLGPMAFDVPLLVPLAWTMFAYPAFLAARRLGGRYVALVGGLALAAWDVALDPQMVAAGRWSWAHPTPALPGVPGIPLTNYAGWLGVGVVMMAVLDRVLPRQAGVSEAQPAVLLLWTWAGAIVGNGFYFDRPAVAAICGVVLGAVTVPYVLTVWGERP